MIRFFTFLLISLLFSVDLAAQNLIPDPSAEDYYQCPNTLGPVDSFLSQWIAYRGTSDYFHSCCELPQLCWNNSLGYQAPRTGDGYIGAVLFSTGLDNAREYFGIEFTEPMEIGEMYYVTFYASMAYRDGSAASYTSNNMGFLLMTENYLEQDEQGIVPNFAHYEMDTLHMDTTNWLRISTSLIADSAYSEIAFGNFYSDELTQYIDPFIPDDSGTAYYYFDDFCVSTDSLGCEEILNTFWTKDIQLSLFPNPCKNQIQFTSSTNVIGIDVFDATGHQIKSVANINATQGELELNFPAGIYLTQFFTNKGYTTKRIMVQ